MLEIFLERNVLLCYKSQGYILECRLYADSNSTMSTSDSLTESTGNLWEFSQVLDVRYALWEILNYKERVKGSHQGDVNCNDKKLKTVQLFL